MRDKVKDNNYFDSLIQKEEQSIMMFEGIVNKAVLEKGEQDKGTLNGYSILINSYQKEINLLYSSGRELESMEKCYKKLLLYYSKMWNRKYGYIELIKVLSLAVLFEIKKNELLELEERIIAEKFDDYLVNFLINSIDPMWKTDRMEFEFEGIYDCLKPILDSNGEFGCEKLKEYLCEKWYELHRECAWYDSHKSSKSIYCGYWSFEAGAIAKILNIDDSSLRNVPYYPYELVHYKK